MQAAKRPEEKWLFGLLAVKSAIVKTGRSCWFTTDHPCGHLAIQLEPAAL